jgi:hypothetical protein
VQIATCAIPIRTQGRWESKGRGFAGIAIIERMERV